MKRHDYYKKCSVVAKALSHPSRLLIMDELLKKSSCVSDLIKRIGADQTTVSGHLLVLKNAGLVQTTKKGLFVYYESTRPCMAQFFSCLEKAMK